MTKLRAGIRDLGKCKKHISQNSVVHASLETASGLKKQVKLMVESLIKICKDERLSALR
jgi:hypothetical protein